MRFIYTIYIDIFTNSLQRCLFHNILTISFSSKLDRTEISSMIGKVEGGTGSKLHQRSAQAVIEGCLRGWGEAAFVFSIRLKIVAL